MYPQNNKKITEGKYNSQLNTIEDQTSKSERINEATILNHHDMPYPIFDVMGNRKKTICFQEVYILIKNSVHIYMHVCVLSWVQLFATPWTVAHQASLSMGFSRQEYWSGLPFSPPGDLSDPGIKPMSPVMPALAGEFF